ncbi:MAG: twin-arginine translocation signal domain-containing protein [Spirosomataceae bacterium]
MQRREFLKSTAMATSAAVVGIDRFVHAAPVVRPSSRKASNMAW